MTQTGDPRLVSLATAVPPYPLDQAAVRERARRIFRHDEAAMARLLPVYDNAGIVRRYSCVPLDWYGQAIGWKARNALYEHHALDLLNSAAQDCLALAGIGAEQVDAVVTVSTTGIATPTLDARLMARMALRRDVERLPVFGLGCCGGVLGLARAASLARSRPGRRVLLLVVELCALTFRAGDRSKSNIVATALFGDGAAAALVSSADGDGGPTIGAAGEYTWPDSLDVMGWHVEDDGLGVLFSRDIPTLVRREFGLALDSFLAGQGMTRRDIAVPACHPGGAKVVTALEEVFGLPPGALSTARRVLRDFGNMSAPTVLFVLRDILAGEAAAGPVLVTALGPGFTAGFLLVHPQRRQ